MSENDPTETLAVHCGNNFDAGLKSSFEPVRYRLLSAGADDMRRRDFITLIGGAAAAWPPVVRAQQPAMPVIGYLSSRSAGDSANIVTAFRKGLNEVGYVEGKNIAIASRFAEGHMDQLPALAAELVSRQVSVLVATGGTSSVIAAKAATATIPIVFVMGGDPVKLKVVASLARPGGNITGVTFLANGLAAKEVQLLHEVVPKADFIGFLVNPNDPNSNPDIEQAQEAADTLRQKLLIVKAGTESDIDTAFSTLAQQKAGALFVDVEPFLSIQTPKILALAARFSLPTVSSAEGFAAAGGLMNYGTSIVDANHQLGIYTGQVLKGTKPADLPVMQPTKFKLVINLKTAKALGVDVPSTLLARADEVIE
jgi:putative ABC transport system substrate-binding protein